MSIPARRNPVSQGGNSVDRETRRRRTLTDQELSRRTFLRGIAAAGIGTAMAGLWEPAHVAQVRGATPASAAGLARGLGSVSNVMVADGGPGRDQTGSDQSAWMAHLLRRAGFAATTADLQDYLPLGINGAVDKLLNFATGSDPGLDAANGAGLDVSKIADAQRWWLMRMVYTNRPLQEKMTLFWHGILTSGVAKVSGPYLNTMLAQNEFLRANALGTSEVLLKGISRDPAMMVWLDLQTSSKAHPNENFARELMELFSLGIGNYTESDVRDGARAFTGYQLTQDRIFVYNAKIHDDGSKSYLGQTGNFNGDQAIDIILAKRSAAEYISKRLWSFFAYPNPEPEVIGPLADTFQASGHNIKAVMQKAVDHAAVLHRSGLPVADQEPGRVRRWCGAVVGTQHRRRRFSELHAADGTGALQPSERGRLAGRRDVDEQFQLLRADEFPEYDRVCQEWPRRLGNSW